MILSPDTLEYQRQLAESRFGEIPPDESIHLPAFLTTVALRQLREHGRIEEENGKKIQRAYLRSIDGNYIWRLTDAEVEVVDGYVHSKGDLTSGLSLEGYSLVEISIPSARGIVPVELRPIDLPRALNSAKLIELAVNNSEESLLETSRELDAAIEARPLLYQLAETQGLLRSYDVDYWSLE